MPVRSLVIPRQHGGRNLVEFLQRAFKLSHAAAMQHLRHRHVRINGKLCTDPCRRIHPGQRVQVELPDRAGKSAAPRKRPVREAPLPNLAKQIRLVYADEHIAVIDKPAGLTTIRHAEETEALGGRARRYLPATLVDLLPRVLPAKYRRGRIRAVHRLDKETSGLLVLARTAEVESLLGKQFRAHAVARTYLAMARGWPPHPQPLSPGGRGEIGRPQPLSPEGRGESERIESFLVRDRGDGRRGSSESSEGQRAVTNVRVVEELGEYALVECRLETGRTHQVRIHLGERGTPLCGERVYDRPVHGQPLPDGSGATRLMLHAATLSLEHPITGKQMNWAADLPGDMATLLARFRGGK
ncbi:MAG: RluA family pseudouridine synthase [Planctomycetes bacterium]|nr:RluA family pseudouridine synthase [Planctomycetota bacterium]